MARKKLETMSISDLKDLLNLVNHNAEVSDRVFRKFMRKNRTAKMLGATAIVCAVYTAVKFYKQEEELYKLSVRVKKLENKEEE